MIEKMFIIFFILFSLFFSASSPPVVNVNNGEISAIGETTIVNITLNR